MYVLNNFFSGLFFAYVAQVAASKQKRQYNNTLLELHREVFKPDYILYNSYTNVMWKEIERQESGFYEELEYYRELLQKCRAFCDPWKDKVISHIEHGKDITEILYSDVSLEIPASRWSKGFTWHPIDCVLSWINRRAMRGIFLQRQFPGKYPPGRSEYFTPKLA